MRVLRSSNLHSNHDMQYLNIQKTTYLLKTLTITIFSIQYHGYKIHTRYSTVIIMLRYHKTKFPLSTFQKITRNAISATLNALNDTSRLEGIQEATEIKILNSAQRLRVASRDT